MVVVQADTITTGLPSMPLIIQIHHLVLILQWAGVTGWGHPHHVAAGGGEHKLHALRITMCIRTW